MDGESSYESDISESWSLIDVNLNEESVLGDEAQILVHNSSSDENIATSKSKELELENQSIRKTLNRCNSDPSLRNEEICDSEKSEDINRKNSDEENKTDGGDSDSIEILDIDANYRETDIDRLDISFIDDQDDKMFPSDEEESFYTEKLDNEDKTICSAVIKRKKRKHSDTSSIDSVNSDCLFSNGKYYSKIRANEVFGDHLSLQTCEFSGRPVYKHYRNNVANTVLSLSMGVIFAGVACIAIGHFLGVHDAGETAAELMESLKKLQMENVALQSRLSHLNRAFHTRDLNSKPNVIPNESLGNNFCIRRQQGKCTKTEFDVPLKSPKISVPSVDHLSTLQNVVETNTNSFKNEKEIHVRKLVNNIHDRLKYLNNKAKNEKLKESGIKISKLVQKIIDRLMYSQDNLEILLQLNDILSKILPVENSCELEEKLEEKKKEKISGIENNVLSVQSTPKKQNEESHNNLAVIFPQQKHYYESESKNKNITKSINNEGMIVIDTSESDLYKPAQEKVHLVVELKPETEKIDGDKKDRIKKERRKSEKKSKKVLKVKEESSTYKKKKDKVWDKKQKFILQKARQTFNETKKFQAKFGKVVKKALNDIKSKRSLIKKKGKKSKLKRVLVSSLFQKQKPRGKGAFKCQFIIPGFKYHREFPSCVNLTGYWVFRWADGRQEFRRHQSLGDWQFDRAKSRKKLRGDNLSFNWQFYRAKSRKKLRGDDLSLNWQFKRALARESNRNDETYRFRSFNEKGFFHEDYSWF